MNILDIAQSIWLGVLSRGDYADRSLFIQKFQEDPGEEIKGVNFSPDLPCPSLLTSCWFTSLMSLKYTTANSAHSSVPAVFVFPAPNQDRQMWGTRSKIVAWLNGWKKEWERTSDSRDLKVESQSWKRVRAVNRGVKRTKQICKR